LTLSPAYRGEGSWGLPLHIRPRIDRMFHRDLPDFCLVRFIEILGNDNLDDGKFIASFAVALDPATFDPHFRPAVGAGRGGELDRAVERGNVHFRAKQGFVEADGEIEIDVQTLAAEIGVGFDAGDDIEVAMVAGGGLLAA